jgi:hypothetical protein
MGKEASFQAMPENCELMIAARQNREIAEQIQRIHNFMTDSVDWFFDPVDVELYYRVQKILLEHPGLSDRYFYAGRRTFDAIVYLLSPQRRAGQYGDDSSLIRQAIYGTERLHPKHVRGRVIQSDW